LAPDGSILRQRPAQRRSPVRSFRWHLGRLVLLAMLPLLLASLAGALLVAREQGRELRRELLQTARFHATIIDTEIERMKRIVAVATATDLLGDQLSETERREREATLMRVAAEHQVRFWLEGPLPGHALLLVDGAGIVPLMRTELPDEARLVRERSTSSGETELGGMTTGLPGLAEPAAPLLKALPGGRGAVGMAITAAGLDRLMQTSGIDEPRSAVLLDAAARRVARSPLAPGPIGGRVSETLARAVAQAGSGVVDGADQLGVTRLAGFAALPNSRGWTMVHSLPTQEVSQTWQGPAMLFAAGIAASFGVAVLLAAFSAERLLRPLAHAAARAGAAAAGQLPPAPYAGAVRVAEFERLEADALMSGERLRHETALLRAVVESTPDPVFVRDRDGRYLIANDAAAANLGHSRAEVVGRLDAELRPDTAALFSGTDQDVLQAGRPLTFEQRLPAGPHGPERVWLASKAPWRDPATGQMLGVVGVAHEITGLLDSKQRLRDAEHALQMLDRRARVSAMATGIAHELSQPLTAAQNFLAVAERAAEPRGPVRRAADELARAAETLHALRGFLVQGEVTRQPEDVAEVLAGAARLALAGARGVSLSVDLEPGLPRLEVSAVQLRQVMVNLVDNAVQAMEGLPPGAPRRVTLAVARLGTGIVASLADTGPGLSAEDARAALEPFRSGKPGGTGLGLAICRAIVEAHGGRLGLSPGEAGGAVARFTLAGPDA
jgi:PAS domain S-box-containing protein